MDWIRRQATQAQQRQLARMKVLRDEAQRWRRKYEAERELREAFERKLELRSTASELI
jgi:hypothetical protein